MFSVGIYIEKLSTISVDADCLDATNSQNGSNTLPLIVYFLASVETEAENDPSAYQKQTSVNIVANRKRPFDATSEFIHNSTEFLSLRDCNATSYSFPFITNSNVFFQFHGLHEMQCVKLRLYCGNKCLSSCSITLNSIFNVDDMLDNVDDISCKESPFDLFLNNEESSSPVCRICGNLEIIRTPSVNYSTSICSTYSNFFWVIYILHLLLFGIVIQDSILRSKGQPLSITFDLQDLPITRKNIQTTNTESSLVAVSAAIGLLRLRSGMSLVQGDLIVGCVGFHSSLCLPALLTIDGIITSLRLVQPENYLSFPIADDGSLLLFTARDYRDETHEMSLRWNSSTLSVPSPITSTAEDSLPDRYIVEPSSPNLPQAVNPLRAFGDWILSLRSKSKRINEEKDVEVNLSDFQELQTYRAVAAGPNLLQIYKQRTVS